MRVWLFALTTLLSVAGCAASNPAPPPVVPRAVPPLSVITDASYADAVRTFERMTPHTKERDELRDRLAIHWLTKADTAMTADRFPEVVNALAQISILYSPDEWAKGTIPGGLERLANY